VRMGMGELLVVLAICVLMFGAKRLPDLADGMGKAIRNFKRGLNTPEEDVTPPQKRVAESSSAAELETESPSPAARTTEPKS
jgi:sec-independent protein translocase protein TatA